MQREKLTIKNEHSHLEIAKANRAKWLGQAEKSIAIKLQSIKDSHTQRTPEEEANSRGDLSGRSVGPICRPLYGTLV